MGTQHSIATSRLGLVGREAADVTQLWPGKDLVYKGWSLTWARIFVVNWNIRNILGYIKRGNIFLPDSVTWMKKQWQVKKKWQDLVKLEITAKTCITLRWLQLVLPTSGPLPRVSGVLSYFGNSKMSILLSSRRVFGQTRPERPL